MPVRSSSVKAKRSSVARKPRVKRPANAAVLPGPFITGRLGPVEREWPLVIVEWDDAWEHATAYESKKLLDKGKCIRRTIGFLIFAEESQVFVAMTDDRAGVHGDNPEVDGDCSTVHRIPRGIIENIIELVPKG